MIKKSFGFLKKTQEKSQSVERSPRVQDSLTTSERFKLISASIDADVKNKTQAQSFYSNNSNNSANKDYLDANHELHNKEINNWYTSDSEAGDTSYEPNNANGSNHESPSPLNSLSPRNSYDTYNTENTEIRPAHKETGFKIAKSSTLISNSPKNRYSSDEADSSTNLSIKLAKKGSTISYTQPKSYRASTIKYNKPLQMTDLLQKKRVDSMYSKKVYSKKLTRASGFAAELSSDRFSIHNRSSKIPIAKNKNCYPSSHATKLKSSLILKLNKLIDDLEYELEYMKEENER